MKKKRSSWKTLFLLPAFLIVTLPHVFSWHAEESEDFRLEKKGRVLKVRIIEESPEKVRAVAVAFRLVKTDVAKKRFRLEVIGDGKDFGKRRFSARGPVIFTIRDRKLPFHILVDEVGKKHIAGRIVRKPFQGTLDVDYYTKKGEWLVSPEDLDEKGNRKIPPPPKRLQYQINGPGVANPVPLQNPAPRYTPSAIKGRVAGTVLLRVVVEQNGRARRLAVLRSVGYRGLDEAAIEQIGNRWKFKPATFEGKDIAILATIEVDYSIGSKVLSVPR